MIPQTRQPSFDWGCHLGHDGKTDMLFVQFLDKGLVVKPSIGADSKVSGVRQKKNRFLKKRDNTFSSMGIAITEESSDGVFEMSFGSNQRMIGFLADVPGVVTFDDTFLMTIKSLGCGIEIDAVTGTC